MVTFYGRSAIIVLTFAKGTTMAASKALRKAVLDGVAGAQRPNALHFLKNFKQSADKADASTAAAVSTKMFADTRTLAASATENLDLNGGGLTGFDGVAVNFTKIHGIYLKPASANANPVVLGGDVTNTMFGLFADETDGVKIGAGDEFLMTSKVGWTVTAATADLLKLANGGAGTPVTYDIVIVGE